MATLEISTNPSNSTKERGHLSLKITPLKLSPSKIKREGEMGERRDGREKRNPNPNFALLRFLSVFPSLPSIFGLKTVPNVSCARDLTRGKN